MYCKHVFLVSPVITLPREVMSIQGEKSLLSLPGSQKLWSSASKLFGQDFIVATCQEIEIKDMDNQIRTGFSTLAVTSSLLIILPLAIFCYKIDVHIPVPIPPYPTRCTILKGQNAQASQDWTFSDCFSMITEESYSGPLGST